MKSKILLLPVIITLASCGTSPFIAPFVATPQNTPLERTSVFVAIDQGSPIKHLATITALNGKPINCSINFGCPVWIRLESGKHTINVRYQNQFYTKINSPAQGYSEAILNIELPEMKPKHVYIARYTLDQASNNVTTKIEDLGQDSKFALRVPVLGDTLGNPTYYPTEF